MKFMVEDADGKDGRAAKKTNQAAMTSTIARQMVEALTTLTRNPKLPLNECFLLLPLLSDRDDPTGSELEIMKWEQIIDKRIAEGMRHWGQDPGMAEALKRVIYRKIGLRAAKQDAISGNSTFAAFFSQPKGIPEYMLRHGWDIWTNPWTGEESGRLGILTGLPGGGKTNHLLNIAEALAELHGQAVLTSAPMQKEKWQPPQNGAALKVQAIADEAAEQGIITTEAAAAIKGMDPKETGGFVQRVLCLTEALAIMQKTPGKRFLLQVDDARQGGLSNLRATSNSVEVCMVLHGQLRKFGTGGANMIITWHQEKNVPHQLLDAAAMYIFKNTKQSAYVQMYDQSGTAWFSRHVSGIGPAKIKFISEGSGGSGIFNWDMSPQEIKSFF